MKVFISVNPNARSDTSNIGPEVAEAIAALKLIRPEYAEWFTARLREVWDAGSPGYKIARHGTPLSKEQKTELGLKGQSVSQEAWDALTDKGRIDAVESCNDMFRRIRSNHSRRMRLAGIARLADRRSWIRHMVLPSCAAAARITGIVLPISEMILFPLPTCNRAYCNCSWQQLSDRDLARLKIKP